MKTIRRTIVSALIAVAATAMLAPAGAAADRIRLGALRFTSHAGGFVAFEKGYFAEQGLAVEFKYFQAAQPMAVAIASGDVDFGVTAITAGLANLADKGAVKVVAGVLQEKPGIDGSAILASNAAFESGLTSPSKLAGHSLGITQTGSSFHYMAHQVAAKEGFDPKAISYKPLQKVGAIIGALKSGQIDAMIIVPHIAKPLDEAGAAKIIGWINAYDDYQVTTAFTSSRIASERTDLVKRFIAAYTRGVADFDAVMLEPSPDPMAVEEMTRLIHKYVYTNRPYEKAAPSIRNGAMLLQPGMRLNLTNVKKQLAWFQSEGLVKPAVAIDALVDARFVETY
jgi:NitT/TauT family transport system substrate-binding protein